MGHLSVGKIRTVEASGPFRDHVRRVKKPSLEDSCATTSAASLAISRDSGMIVTKSASLVGRTTVSCVTDSNPPTVAASVEYRLCGVRRDLAGKSFVRRYAFVGHLNRNVPVTEAINASVCVTKSAEAGTTEPDATSAR